MNIVRVIFEYDKIISQLDKEIKKSNYKIQYFLDLLQLKRSFFYKKLKEKRFTSSEMKKLSKVLYPEEYKKYEIQVINELIERSREQIKNKKGQNFELLIEDQKKRYGV